MGAWKEPKKKFTIAKNGKKSGAAKYVGMEHKNSQLKGCSHHNTWSGYGQGTIKIKRPEGVYEFKIIASYKTGQKVKGIKKGPIPPDCKADSAWEFTEIKIYVDKLKMPLMHTCEVDVSLSRIQNRGTAKDFDPWAMFNLDIRTGHMVTGSWTTSLHVCDVFAGQQRVKIK